MGRGGRWALGCDAFAANSNPGKSHEKGSMIHFGPLDLQCSIWICKSPLKKYSKATSSRPRPNLTLLQFRVLTAHLAEWSLVHVFQAGFQNLVEFIEI
jgi:hypothetical protein